MAEAKLGNSMIARLLRWMSGAAYAVLVAAAALAYWDKTGKGFLGLFLDLSFQLSVVFLVVGAIVLGWILEKDHIATASASGEGLIVLGGGILAVCPLIMPIAKVTEKYLSQMTYAQSAAQTNVFILLGAAFLAVNFWGLHSLKEKRAGSTTGDALLLLPLVIFQVFWLMALGKGMYLYGLKSTDSIWLKIFIEAVNGIYCLVLCASGTLTFNLFNRDWLE